MSVAGYRPIPVELGQESEGWEGIDRAGTEEVELAGLSRTEEGEEEAEGAQSGLLSSSASEAEGGVDKWALRCLLLQHASR